MDKTKRAKSRKLVFFLPVYAVLFLASVCEGAEEITIVRGEAVILQNPSPQDLAQYGLMGKNSTIVIKPKAEKIEKTIFQKSVKAAVSELEGSISGTCAKEISATLQIGVKGEWKIIEVGIGGTLEVKVGNPKLGSHCHG